MLELWKFAFLAFCAGFGAYLGSYLKKKGENLATREDITDLVTQVRAVTTATKEIEAKISDAMWDRQKRWELKREALLEAARSVAIVKDRLSQVHAVYQTEKNAMKNGEPARPEKQTEVFGNWNAAADSLEQSTLLVGLVCGKEVTDVLMSFNLFTRTLSQKMASGQPEAMITSAKELVNKMNALQDAMRNELGVEPLSIPSTPVAQ
jgi:hypothetical protein